VTVKHYVDNNQEQKRNTVSVEIDKRTQHEIYYPAYQRAIDDGVGSVMCSYNKVNNIYACENKQTLMELKNEMGFQGFVQSDWGATHSTVQAANSGLDMEMPDARFFGTPLTQAVASGQVTEDRLNDMVLRILTALFAVGVMDDPPNGNLNINVTNEEHAELARTLSEAATVLLKNEKGILPLSTDKKIAVIGDDGDRSPTIAGGGSGHVIAPYVISPYKGIMDKTKSVTYSATTPLDQAVAAAKAADVAVVFVATSSSEGSDRPNLSLGAAQDNLVNAVVAAQPNTVVVIHGPGAVLMPWVDSVPAILTAFMPGQESGNAIASVLFGDVNPSAKLPVTFPRRENQVPANTTTRYPGINLQEQYSEKLLVGYRWYDAEDENPLFPFGHGLSYTTFEYNDLKVMERTVSGSIKNTGMHDGSEVVQLYIGYPETAGEPPKVLRGFKKIHLAVGGMADFSFTLTTKDLSIWDTTKSDWSEVKGSFGVWVGSSSRDIRLKGTLTN